MRGGGGGGVEKALDPKSGHLVSKPYWDLNSNAREGREHCLSWITCGFEILRFGKGAHSGTKPGLGGLRKALTVGSTWEEAKEL